MSHDSTPQPNMIISAGRGYQRPSKITKMYVPDQQAEKQAALLIKNVRVDQTLVDHAGQKPSSLFRLVELFMMREQCIDQPIEPWQLLVCGARY